MPAQLTPEETSRLRYQPEEKLAALSEPSEAAVAASTAAMDDDPCIQVLSAHPVAHMRPWMLSKAPYFLAPSDATVRGSTGAFAAVVSELSRSKRMLLARCVMRAGSSPRLVVLIPQVERPGVSLSSTGLVMFDLPFADDFRTPKLPCGSPVAPHDAVEAAKDVVQAISLGQFDPDHFPSPTLGRFFATARAMALGEHELSWDAERDDVAKPDPAMGENPRFVDPLLRLAEFVNAPFEVSDRASKRPAGEPGSGAPAKRSKKAPDGSLESMTVAQLKARAQELSLTVGKKKKAELIEMLRAHEG